MRKSLVLILALCLAAEAAWPQSFPRWHLPRDFNGVQHKLRLVALRLPPAVDRLDWLVPSVRSLEAHGASIEDLHGLPQRLETLDVSYTGISRVPPLPELKTLNITATKVRELSDLPPGVETLLVGGEELRELAGMPGSVTSLTIDRAPRIQQLVGLSPKLTELNLKNLKMMELAGLPEKLQTLRIESTPIRSLNGLPADLRTLELRRNSSMRFREVPYYLNTLLIEGQEIPPLGRIRSLRHLHLIEPQSPLPAIPDSVVTLSIESISFDSLPAFPGSLQRLSLRASAPRGRQGLVPPLLDLAALPRQLTHLDITGCTNQSLAGIPADHLTHLTASFCDELRSLDGLPPKLAFLDISQTAVQGWQRLPNLRELHFRAAKLKEMPPLPGTLRVLDLSGSQLLQSLDRLPSGLEELNVAGTGLARLPDLPPTLKTLNIGGSRIHSLKGLKPGLETLVVSPGQISRFEELPSTVKAIRFEE